MRRRILFYCQPMLGLGHLTRSLAILRGLARFDIWMVNGGRPLPAFLVPTLPPHLTIVQLPPLQADPAFETVESVTTSGDDRATIEEERRTALLDGRSRQAQQGRMVAGSCFPSSGLLGPDPVPLPPYILHIQDDERMLQDIQRFYNTVIEELPSNVADLI